MLSVYLDEETGELYFKNWHTSRKFLVVEIVVF
jgi:hypothetical protein